MVSKKFSAFCKKTEKRLCRAQRTIIYGISNQADIIICAEFRKGLAKRSIHFSFIYLALLMEVRPA